MKISKLYSSTPIIAAVLFAVVSLTPSSHAVIITLGGTDYDVVNSAPITIVDFLASTTPAAQPWWGSQTDAASAAAQVATGLGNPNSSFGGPIFAWSSNATTLYYSQYNSGSNLVEDTFITISINTGTRVFAIATPTTSTPDTGTTALLLGVGLLGLAAIRRRMGSN